MAQLVDQHTLVAVIRPLGIVLDVVTGAATLNERRSPYAQARLTCLLPDPADRTLIDLRGTDELRLELTFSRDFGDPVEIAEITAAVGGSMAALTSLLGGQPLSQLTNLYHVPWNSSSVRPSVSRTLNLFIAAREFDDVAGTLEIEAESNELKLINDALVASAPLDPGSADLKTIVQSVLNRYGYTLAADAMTGTVANADATIWQPGVSAFDYLDPMLEAASLRLWSDPTTGAFSIGVRQPTTDGAVTITPLDSMTGHRDRMTFDPDVWNDAVIVEYRWVDDAGENQVEWDPAGAVLPRSPKRVLRRDTRFPGPGAAAGILNRGQGRGRVLDITEISNYAMTPGMAATITPPETDAQTGFVSAVTWHFPDGEADVVTRGLVDTPATAWLFGDVGDDWVDVPVGLKWNTFDWSLV